MLKRHEPMSRTWQITPDLLCISTPEGKLTKTNPAFAKVLGYTREEIESCIFFELIHPDDMAPTAKAFADVQMGKPVLNFVNRYRHKNGSYRYLCWNAVPEDGVYYSSARDITEWKEAQSQLEMHQRDAELREQFISILGHDLRNPLAGAICAIEYLRDREPQSENGTLTLETANASLQRMSALIDDVLDFARARLGGDIGIEMTQNSELTETLHQTVAEIKLANPELVIEEIYSFTDPVTCDLARIAQLVSNLLGNAVYHGEDGAPIQIHAQDAGEDIAISVTNRGRTIPSEVRELLFQPFKRAEPGASQNGLGLGLFIAKQIAEAHHGDITVASGNGETSFTLRLPRGARIDSPCPREDPLISDTAARLAAQAQGLPQQEPKRKTVNGRGSG